MPKIDVSFKKTTRDMHLYMNVMDQEEKSEFVKKAIEHYLEYLKSQNKVNS